MSFLDTEPAAIDRLEVGGPWSRFRVADPRVRRATLRALRVGDVPITLGVAGGPTVGVALWSIDDVRGRLQFNVTRTPEAAAAVAAAGGVWAAAYLDEAKVQFAIPRVVCDTSPAGVVLYADPPSAMLHLPRRRAMRVRRAAAVSPQLQLSARGETPAFTLRVVDISTSGCALWHADAATARTLLPPGRVVDGVDVALDADTQFSAALRVQHASRSVGADGGAHIGCAWVDLAPAALDVLQRWIRGGRRRRELISLALD